jgi:hypothetical protein
MVEQEISAGLTTQHAIAHAPRPMWKIFDLPRLDPASLAGYREDKTAWKRFERRFGALSVIGVVLVFGGPIAHMMGKISTQMVFISMMLGFLILLNLFLMFKSAPISSSGHRMKMYWSTSPKAGNNEAVYVCEHSKTYFIRVWAMPSRD